MTEVMSTTLNDLARSLEVGFNRALGFTLQEASATRVSATLELSDEHQQPFGLVHGGLYCAVVETLASVGGALAWTGPGRTVVGVNNNTDFIRGVAGGKLFAEALPIHSGRTQQLWEVVITDSGGKLIAKGFVRLANLQS